MAAMDKKQLVEQHLSLVQAIARKLKKTLRTSIEYDDLVAYGSKGLVEAAERYDARPGVAFTTFAYYRIRGAMFDGLRTMGWYSRADYARYRAEERANEYLQSLSDREAAAAQQGGAEAAPAERDPAQTLDSIAEALSGLGAIHHTSLE